MRKAAVLVVLVLSMTVSAHAILDLSFGAYGGLNAPIVQEDAKTGTDFGIKAKFAPAPFVAASLFYEWRKFGDVERTILEGTPGETTVKVNGGKVKVFGLQAMLGSAGGGIGPHFYGMAGVFNYKWTREGFSDVSKVGYDIGAGMEIVVPAGIGIEGQAKFEIIPTGNGGSRKNGLAFLGLNYHFGIGPM